MRAYYSRSVDFSLPNRIKASPTEPERSRALSYLLFVGVVVGVVVVVVVVAAVVVVLGVVVVCVCAVC